MNKTEIRSGSELEIRITLTLTEVEARALYDMAGYGTKAFLEAFYKHLGKHYLYKNERGVYSLFDTIKKELPKHFHKIEVARKAIQELNK